jgi:hypothetical protein
MEKSKWEEKGVGLQRVEHGAGQMLSEGCPRGLLEGSECEHRPGRWDQAMCLLGTVWPAKPSKGPWCLEVNRETKCYKPQKRLWLSLWRTGTFIVDITG